MVESGNAPTKQLPDPVCKFTTKSHSMKKKTPWSWRNGQTCLKGQKTTINQIFPFWWLKSIVAISRHPTQQAVKGSLCLMAAMEGPAPSRRSGGRGVGGRGWYQSTTPRVLCLPLVCVSTTILEPQNFTRKPNPSNSKMTNHSRWEARRL